MSNESDSGGLLRHLGALLAAKLAYLRARLELAGIEGKEAFAHVAIMVGLAIAAVIAAIFGYFFLVIAVVFLIARAIGGEVWIWVMLGAAGLHLGGALVLALVARARLARPIFPATLDELRKDQQWLKTPENPS